MGLAALLHGTILDDTKFGKQNGDFYFPLAGRQVQGPIGGASIADHF